MRHRILKKIFYFFIIILFFGLVVALMNNFSSNVMGIQNIRNINSVKELNKDNPEIIIYVDDINGSGSGNPPENYTRIQDAINSITDPNTAIYVYNGTYNESIFINKPFKCLKGSIPYPDDADNHGSIINATKINNRFAISIESTNHIGFFIVDNFVVKNFNNNGIMIHDKKDIVSNCIISDCIYGLSLQEAHNCKILYNNITNNSDHGIIVEQSFNNIFKYNNISNNNGYGISLAFLSFLNKFYYNNISYNKLGGILTIFSPFNKFHFNNIFKNKSDIGLCNWFSSTNARFNWWGASCPYTIFKPSGQKICWNIFGYPLDPIREYLLLFPWQHVPVNIYKHTITKNPI